MSETKNQPPAEEVVTTADPKEQPKEEGKETEPKTFTQEDLNAAVSKRVNDLNKKHADEVKRQIADALEEERKLAKLDAEGKEKALREKQSKELEDKEKSITLRENRAEAMEKFASLGIPTNLVDFVVNIDKEIQEKNIESLKSSFDEAVNKGVETKLAGKTPEDPGSSNKGSGTKEIVTSF